MIVHTQHTETRRILVHDFGDDKRFATMYKFGVTSDAGHGWAFVHENAWDDEDKAAVEAAMAEALVNPTPRVPTPKPAQAVQPSLVKEPVPVAPKPARNAS